MFGAARLAALPPPEAPPVSRSGRAGPRHSPQARCPTATLPLPAKSSRKVAGPGSGSGGGECPAPKVPCRARPGRHEGRRAGMGAPRYQATGRPLSRSKGPDLWPVARTAALLVGVGRAEPVTGFVVDQPCQKAWRFGVGRGASLGRIAVQAASDSVEGLPLDDAMMLTRIRPPRRPGRQPVPVPHVDHKAATLRATNQVPLTD